MCLANPSGLTSRDTASSISDIAKTCCVCGYELDPGDYDPEKSPFAQKHKTRVLCSTSSK
ncbi:MAG: hypothetical protein NTZ65_04135 [Candidatus Berkelbacteria bacterium]|nr:hypothetical protein [Candidatus Berkelbacteria bacterium]